MSNIHTLTDHVKVVGNIPPQSAAVPVNGGWVDMAGARRITYLLHIGDAGNAAINAKIQQAQDAAGAGVKDVTGAALEEIAADAAANDNKEHAITLAADLLDDGYNFVRIQLHPAAASLVGATGIQYRMHRNPAPDKGLVQDVRKVL